MEERVFSITGSALSNLRGDVSFLCEKLLEVSTAARLVVDSFAGPAEMAILAATLDKVTRECQEYGRND